MQLLAILVTFLAIATLSLSFSTTSSSWSLYLRRKANSVHKLSSSDNTDTSSSSSTTCPNAPKCNGSYRTKGCDGSGKIKGGLGALPGFGWVGAKVYRPCPAYLQAGYVYEREGQTLEQVLFSEPSTKMKQRYESNRAAEEEKQQQQEGDTNTVPGEPSKTVDQVKKEGDNVDDDSVERIYKERFGPGKQ